ncbi:uncharacterized protein BT62DRAFT_935886 [Guyanagaster necrorhizus]|uniref:GmrSD restriction endonucleases N-terminal domain-containing protein n=1 Tax=Guyanagaster necrorhizus TaxID=856835 RepID=A0A9P8AP96_9AGAR|nr:uncharacterized protein BT62DRAFT_935886 [Guyanagaster necrorhizus MCA 3950]KAG7442581.1 hypothetical protein BT62DRAFT_935886 [Guyanagaster necrorhizus MCA 3950]
MTLDDEGSCHSESGDEIPAASSSKPTLSSKPTSNPPKNEPEEYRLSNALKVPRATTYTAQALYEQILNNDIDLDPEYQRGEVWKENKQTGLVDSILRNFYIPPVIFAVNTFEDGTERRTCIDGKQRLTSIHRFMEGFIPHRDHDTGRKYWYRDHPGVPGRQKTILPESLRRIFANKQIVCVEYSDLTDDGERDIFQRVQLGVALTPAEKLQAVSGPRVQVIRELMATHPLDNIPFDRSRATDFRCFVTLAHALAKYPKMNNVLIEPSQLTKWLKADEEMSEAFRTKMEETLVRMAEVSVPDKGKDKVSPVEVVFIGVLANAVSDGRELSDLVAEMRSDARAVFQGTMRLNSQVGKHMMAFVKSVDPSRKREREDEDEDEDDREEKPKRRRIEADSTKSSRAQQQIEDFAKAKGKLRLIKEAALPNPQRLPSP